LEGERGKQCKGREGRYGRGKRLGITVDNMERIGGRGKQYQGREGTNGRGYRLGMTVNKREGMGGGKREAMPG
jgi:hypothetical protein